MTETISVLEQMLATLRENTSLEVEHEPKRRMLSLSAAEAAKRYPAALMTEYGKVGNGFDLTWWKNREEGIGGAIRLMPTTSLQTTQPWLISMCDSMPDLDQDLRHFKLLDIPFAEMSAGFYEFPGEKTQGTMYFMTSTQLDTQTMDLDIEGYLEMALRSKAYFYWQVVIGDLARGKESHELKEFRRIMPNIFPGFSWDEYVAAYQALRLSLKNKEQ